MNFMIAKKLGMTRRFRDDGTVVPVTVLQAGPVTVTQVKSQDRDGYVAVQLGFGQKRNVNKPQRKAGMFAHVHEFRLPATDGLETGKVIDVTGFTAGEKLKVTATSKGKGFQGVVKRHHFRGGPASHGHKDNLRAPGSIGATFPQHVMKGTRMAGRMGGERVSVKNLEVIDVVPEQHLLLVKGAVPGPRNGLVYLETAA
ncbi:MAG: 50S ribosomal protein L3 [Candidatus Kerfeldbacteria bacterium]|nr:50S ribosomal protein L3 [Candidatus Kerfeldbacteria bacterium]